MQPIKRTITGAASLVVPLTTYGRVGCSFSADVAVIVSPLTDRDDATSVIEAIASATGGSFAYPADAVLVTTTATTNVVLLQYGD